MKILLRSAHLFDPTQGLHGQVRDLGIAGGRLVPPAELGVPDRELNAEALAVTAAALDPASWIAPPEAVQLRRRFAFPSLDEIGRRYAERGYCHVHHPFAGPLTALATRRQLQRLPLVDSSMALAVPLYDLQPMLAQDQIEEAAARLGALAAALGTRGLYLVEPALSYRLEVYRHKDLAADRVLPLIAELARRLGQSLTIPAAALADSDWDRLPAGIHLERLGENRGGGEDESGGGGGGGRRRREKDDCDYDTDSDSDSDADAENPGAITADLGLEWKEPGLVARWRRDGERGEGWIVDHGLSRELVWERREGFDFRRDPEWNSRLRRFDPDRLALTAAAANLALIDDWTGLVEAVLGIFPLDQFLRLTRTTPARVLNQPDRGHLNWGARADLACYPLPAEDSPRAWAEAMSRCHTLVRDGRVVLEPGRPLELDRCGRVWAEAAGEGAVMDPDFLEAGLTLRTQTLLQTHSEPGAGDGS